MDTKFNDTNDMDQVCVVDDDTYIQYMVSLLLFSFVVSIGACKNPVSFFSDGGHNNVDMEFCVCGMYIEM